MKAVYVITGVVLLFDIVGYARAGSWFVAGVGLLALYWISSKVREEVLPWA